MKIMKISPTSISTRLSPFKPAFGWEPDPFSTTDHSFEDSPLNVKIKQSKNAIDNRHFYKDVSDQLHLPSCTANAVADFWEAVLIQQLINVGANEAEAKKSIPDLSRLFLMYYGKLYMDPPRHKDIDSGCYNRLIMEVLARFGVPSEKTWPYIVNNACTRPSITSQREAFKHRSKAFYKIFRDNRLFDNIIKALHQIPGVVFGTGLGEGFFRYKKDEILNVPNKIVGRHAMVIVGYDDKKSAFIVRNSHGKRFGDNGHCLMSVEYVLWGETRSFWTAEVIK